MALGTVFERLCDICETSEVAEVARCLGLHYNTVRNYQEGRHPRPEVLISIVEHFQQEHHGKTISLTWLLMAQGPRFLEDTGLDILKGATIEIKTPTETVQLTLSPPSDDPTTSPGGSSKNPDTEERLPLVTMRDEHDDQPTATARTKLSKRSRQADEQGGKQ